ncbi:type III PLP-dependent enzyme [Proteobacteria bacterium 005FR1]|nr:type III PLP-dependent enzyme [Proteobacteria bacterium 005FR1]
MSAVGGDILPFVARPSEGESVTIHQLVAEYGAPLLILDGDIIRRQYRALSAALPGVELHYALKPLPHADVVDILMEEGACFDLATTGEVELVASRGVSPERCIHSHPIKRDRDIREALDHGVKVFVADNADELLKFLPYRDRAQVMLRVSFRSPDAVVDLSKKFGCAPAQVMNLLEEARRFEVQVVGLCFHVGSQTTDPRQYVTAINTCGQLITQARAEGFDLRVLDIGGGFPVSYGTVVPEIHGFCGPIREALARLPEGLRLLAEPGRFIVAPAVTSVASVMGRARRDGRWWYYLDDGVYGSFSGQIFDHMRYPLEVIGGSGQVEPSVLAGPTCDSIDVIAEDIALPELQVGDLIVGRVMGAYTWASATDFNFFRRATLVTLNGAGQVQAVA